MTDVSKPHSVLDETRAFLAGHERVIPIFRKTDTITAGADAFTRARDIEAVLDSLPRLIEQLETLQQERDQFERWLRFYSDLKNEEIDYMVGNWHAMVGASSPASEPETGNERVKRVEHEWREAVSNQDSSPESPE